MFAHPWVHLQIHIMSTFPLCPKKASCSLSAKKYSLMFDTDIAKILISKFTTYSTGSHDILTNPYHPNLSSLYIHFVTMLCDVCYPFSHDPQDLQYIAAARWVGFVKPLIDDYKQRLAKQNDGEDGEDMDTNETEFIAPSEDLRIRLLRYFNASFTTAMEALLPRQTNAADWALVNEPPDNLLSMSRAEGGYRQQPMVHSPLATHNGIHSLPRMSKFIMIASFLASMNPAKSDLRMFGRGIDEKKRRRRVMKTERKTKSSAPAKVCEELRTYLFHSVQLCISDCAKATWPCAFPGRQDDCHPWCTA